MFDNDPKKSKAKHIRFGDRLYPKIWQLSSSYYKTILRKHRDDMVPKMGKNHSDNIRYLGQAMIEMRFRKGRGDLHSAAADHVQMELAMHDEMHCKLEFLYFLSQRELLKWALDRWSLTMDDKKKATDDDRLRLLLIIFTEEISKCDPPARRRRVKASLISPDTNPPVDASWAYIKLTFFFSLSISVCFKFLRYSSLLNSSSPTFASILSQRS
jgi:hypothetical protein